MASSYVYWSWLNQIQETGVRKWGVNILCSPHLWRDMSCTDNSCRISDTSRCDQDFQADHDLEARFPYQGKRFGHMNKFDHICQQMSSFPQNLYMSCTFLYSSWEWWSLGLPYSCIMGSKVWRQGRRQLEKWALNRCATQCLAEKTNHSWWVSLGLRTEPLEFSWCSCVFRSLLDQPGEDAGGLVLDLLHSCHYFPCRIPAVFSRHSVLSSSGSGLHRKLSDGHCQTKGPGGQETF